MKSTTGKRILIVEDEVIAAEDLREILEKDGYEVCATLSSGEAAVERFPELHPDLVLMDISLNGKMDGIEAAGRISAFSPVPVVYLTAFHDEETLERAKDSHPYGYLVKPFAKETVHTTIQVALAKNRFDTHLLSLSSWLDMTLRSLDRGIVTLDRNGYVVLMNARAEALAGVTFDASTRRLAGDVLHFYDADRKEPFIPNLPSVLSEGLTVGFPFNTRLVASSGTEHRISDTVLSPVYGRDGTIQGAILVFTPGDNAYRASAGSGEQKNNAAEDTESSAPRDPAGQDRLIRIREIRDMIGVESLLEQATLRVLFGKYEEAEKIYDLLTARDPGNYQAWHNRGNVLVNLGRLHEALHAFDRALELCPESGESRKRRSDVCTILSMRKREIKGGRV